MTVCVCGANNDHGAEFCGDCGEPLDHPDERGDQSSYEPATSRVPAQTDQTGDLMVDDRDLGSGDPALPPPPETSTAGVHRAADRQPTTAAAAPGEVQPGEARKRVRRSIDRTDDDRPAPGDLICGQCGRGNVPTRRYCRRCGADLADAPVAAPLTWWQRLRQRRARTPLAGERRQPRTSRFPVRSLVLLVVLGLVAWLGWTNRERLGEAYDAVVDRVVGQEPINPAEVSASTSAPDRTPQLAWDGIKNRSWAPAPTGAGVGEYIVATFDEPFRLMSVLVTSGASDEQGPFLAEGRVRVLRMTATREDGTTMTEDLPLQDTRGAQQFDPVADDVVEVKFTIISAYAVPDGQRVAIAEIEFSGRR